MFDLAKAAFRTSGGAQLARRRNLNFVGATAVDNPATDSVDITIPGDGGAGLALTSYNVTLLANGTIGAANPDAMNTASSIRVAQGASYIARGAEWSVAPSVTHPSKTLFNDSAFDLILTHEDGAATAKNRFKNPGAVPVAIPPGKSRALEYDYTAQRVSVVPQDDGVITAPTLEASIVTPGRTNERRVTSGFAAANGSAPFDIWWSNTPGTVDNAEVYATFSGQGSWRRARAGFFLARSMGPVGDGIADDTAAIENSMGAALKAKGDEYYLDRGGVYKLTNTVFLDSQSVSRPIPGSCKIAGGGGGAMAGVGAKFLWAGASDRPMVSLQTNDVSFRNVEFGVAGGFTCRQLMDFRQGAFVSTHPVFADCIFSGGAHGFTFNYDADLNANLEEATFLDCLFVNQTIASVLVAGGQAFHTKFIRCGFLNFLGAGGGTLCNGRGVWVKSTGQVSSLHFDSCTWGRLSIGVQMDQPVLLTFHGQQDCEHMRRWIDSPANGGVGCPVESLGSRLGSSIGYGTVATNPSIAADDNRFVNFATPGQVAKFSSIEFSSGHVQPDWCMAFPRSGNISIEQSWLPGPHPFRRSVGETFSPAEPVGTMHRKGCIVATVDVLAPGSRTWLKLPDTDGCDNGPFQVKISGSTSSQLVNLYDPEPDALYTVELCVLDASSGAAANSKNPALFTYSDRTRFGFQLTLGAAPGSSEWVIIGVRIRREAEPASASAITGINGILATTMVRSSGDGMVGSASGCWWIVGGVQKAPPSGQENPAIRYASGLGWTIRTSASGVHAQCADGSGVYDSAVLAWRDSMFGKVQVYGAVHTGTQLKFFALRQLIGAAVTCNMAPAAGGTKTRFGNGVNNTNSFAPSFFAGGHGVPSDAQMLAYFDALKAAGGVPPVMGGGVSTTKRVYLNALTGAVDAVGGTETWQYEAGESSGTAPTLITANQVWGW